MIFELSAFQGMFTLFLRNFLEYNLLMKGPISTINHFGIAFLGRGYLVSYLSNKDIPISKKFVLTADAMYRPFADVVKPAL